MKILVATACRARGARARRGTGLPDAGRFLDAADADLSRSAAGAGGTGRRRAAARAAAAGRHPYCDGRAARPYRAPCLLAARPFTTRLHTRFPDYLAERLPVPERWTCDVAWGFLQRFHCAGAAVLAATPALGAELSARGFKNVKLWPRGVDTGLFRPRISGALDLPRPIFLTVGRLAVEKNVEAFLKLDLPGTKLVVGDGPARNQLTKAYPDAVFVGSREGEALAEIYAAADVFVFPSRTDTFGLVLLEALAS